MSSPNFRKLDPEVLKLHDAILVHMKVWSTLETALSKLLYDILRIQPRTSQIAYVIYYSPDGFDARQKIVDRAFKQFL